MSQDIEVRRQAIAARNYEQEMWNAFQSTNRELIALGLQTFATIEEMREAAAEGLKLRQPNA
jgi:hypothetical protein